MKVWDRASIKLMTPRFSVKHVSAVSHVTDGATQPFMMNGWMFI